MDVIVDHTNSRGGGTFKFQYSRRVPVKKDPFIPKDKRIAEEMVAYFFSQTLLGNYYRNIGSVKRVEDDANKNADMLMLEDQQWKGIQITQLQFTNYIGRKAISERMNTSIATAISRLVSPPNKVIVNIFPVATKGEIPLSEVGKGKDAIFDRLEKFAADALKKNATGLTDPNYPVWISVDDDKLKPHLRTICLNPVPPDGFPRFPGVGNVFVNYDQDDVAYNEDDITSSVTEIYNKKEGGKAEILLIWADEFDLGVVERKVAEQIQRKFTTSSFAEVYLMTFTNHITMILDTINLWPLKTTGSYLKRPLRPHTKESIWKGKPGRS
jgi:hypothetical protein